MTIHMINPHDQPPLRIGFYSLPGAGKTTLIGSFALDPRTSPILLIDYNANVTVLNKIPLDNESCILRLSDPQELNAIYLSLKSEQKVGVLKDLPLFKTIAIDCVTDLQRLVFAEEGKYNDSNKMYVKPPKREYSDFQVALDVMMNLAEALTWLPQHVLLSFWAKKKDIQEKEGFTWVSREIYELGLDGRSRNDLPGYIQSLGFLERNPYWSPSNPNNTHYNTLSFRFSKDIYAKETLGFKSTYNNPNATQLLDDINYSID